FENGQRSFHIEGVAAAGSITQTLKNGEACLEVMTGSVLPINSDTVIRYEDLSIENGVATINVDTLKFQQNVHFKGEDRKAGDKIIEKNRIIASPEIGVLATVGMDQVKVAIPPKIAIISTGDELVEINEQPLPHQIRKSNVHRLKSSLQQMGFTADSFHLNDNKEEIKSTLSYIITKYQVVMLSGGVSKGKFDYIPSAMEELGVKKLFHKIAQRPGKPFWFGRKNDTVFFALPGNPVSSFLNMTYYFKNWYFWSLDVKVKKQYAKLSKEISFKPDLTYFAQVQLEFDETGQLWATPNEGHGSGDLANLTDADAFIILPRGRTNFEKGTCFEILKFRK
ncbi:MAG: molybdopterin molybdotransferase MoeA, partial [Bacteroidota bacterium]